MLTEVCGGNLGELSVGIQTGTAVRRRISLGTWRIIFVRQKFALCSVTAVCENCGFGQKGVCCIRGCKVGMRIVFVARDLVCMS